MLNCSVSIVCFLEPFIYGGFLRLMCGSGSVNSIAAYNIGKSAVGGRCLTVLGSGGMVGCAAVCGGPFNLDSPSVSTLFRL